MNTWRLLFVIVAIIIALKFFVPDEVSYSPGVVAPHTPEQQSASSDSFEHKGYTITPLADFEITARVLSREDYHLGPEAVLSPVDLALGWGPMSDEQVLSKITITQSNRWYHWRVDEFPIPRRDIERNSANMHMLPANESVESVIKQTSRGDVVSLRGKLVLVTKPDGWRWKSSLTRDDTGNGSCEVVWVEAFSIE